MVVVAIETIGNADIAGVGNLSPVAAAGQWRVGKLAPAALFRFGGRYTNSLSLLKSVINPMKNNTKIVICGLVAEGSVWLGTVFANQCVEGRTLERPGPTQNEQGHRAERR